MDAIKHEVLDKMLKMLMDPLPRVLLCLVMLILGESGCC